MNRPVKISGVVITFNEEDRIGQCLASMKEVVDEIIVVDSFSTDGTQQICRDYGAKFYQRIFDGYIEQKNYANSLASHDYILSLDADECLSDKMVNEILKIKTGPEYDVYSFNRLTQFQGKWIRHCGWYPDRKKRLWRKGIGYWGGPKPHERLETEKDATQTTINADILHYSFNNYDDYFTRQIQYANIMAEASAESSNTYKNNLLFRYLNPAFTFFRDYFLRLGFIDGKEGLMICLGKAKANYFKYKRIGELIRDKRKADL